MTKQRALIKQIILESKRHLSAQEVYDLAKMHVDKIAMATIYNNLNALSENGDIRRLKLDQRVELFDGCVEPHDHLVCESCGRIEDIYLEHMLDKLEELTGIQPSGYDLCIRYKCDRCK